MERFAIVEKRNHLAIHGLFHSRGSAERFLVETIPDYVRRSFFMDKSLTADDFEVIECKEKARRA